MAQLIFDLKNVNPDGDVSVKLVSEVGVGTVAAGVSKARSDHVTIAGYEGGTGAAPLTSVKHAGSPWEIGLAETHQTLVANRLRGRIAVQVDGGIRTGRDVVVGALLGADEFGFATAPLIAAGCIMMRKCHLNTCPVGVATQDPVLRKRFTGQPEHVINYFFFVAEEVRELMAELGYRTFDEMIGQMQMFDQRKLVAHGKASGLDFSKLFMKPDVPASVKIFNCERQDHKIHDILDRKLIAQSQTALASRHAGAAELPDQQRRPHRRRHAVGRDRQALRPCRPAGRHHRGALYAAPPARASAPSSPAASPSSSKATPTTMSARACPAAASWCARPPPPASCRSSRSSSAIPCSTAPSRANAISAASPASASPCAIPAQLAVIEGAGDHCCEYMTGGVVVVLGLTGRNFAAGMSGGIAYVLDDDGSFASRCNMAMVELEPMPDEEDINAKVFHHARDLEAHGMVDIMSDMSRFDGHRLHHLISRHARFTGSRVAANILERLENLVSEIPQGDAGRVSPRAQRTQGRGHRGGIAVEQS